MGRAAVLILLTLLEMILFSAPTSSAAEPVCPAHETCEPQPSLLPCRATDYYWLPVSTYRRFQKSDIPANAQMVNQRAVKQRFGNMALAQFHDGDGVTHLSTLGMDGKVHFNNYGNVASLFKVLCHYDVSGGSAKFKYEETWPGTMQARKIQGSPDLREAAVVVGVENNQFVYLGTLQTDEPVYGKIYKDRAGTYELHFRDLKKGRRFKNKKFYVLTHTECVNTIEKYA